MHHIYEFNSKYSKLQVEKALTPIIVVSRQLNASNVLDLINSPIPSFNQTFGDHVLKNQGIEKTCSDNNLV